MFSVGWKSPEKGIYLIFFFCVRLLTLSKDPLIWTWTWCLQEMSTQRTWEIKVWCDEWCFQTDSPWPILLVSYVCFRIKAPLNLIMGPNNCCPWRIYNRKQRNLPLLIGKDNPSMWGGHFILVWSQTNGLFYNPARPIERLTRPKLCALTIIEWVSKVDVFTSQHVFPQGGYAGFKGPKVKHACMYTPVYLCPLLHRF